MAEIRVLTWNLFHGRDAPPDPGLRTWRSKLLGTPEHNDSHVQLNRELEREFTAVIGGARWDVALLQESPPRWHERLAALCEAEEHLVLTSRNSSAALRAALARRNPDLLGSWEGGSNLTLVRPRGAGGGIVERRELELARRPERRTMAMTRLASGHCIANLHASTAAARAEAELADAAAEAVRWAAGAPLVLGGDFNLRPSGSPRAFDRLRDEHSLVAPTGPDAIDHLLARGLAILSPPAPWPVSARELELDGLALRLSDHDPVEGLFGSR